MYTQYHSIKQKHHSIMFDQYLLSDCKTKDDRRRMREPAGVVKTGLTDGFRRKSAWRGRKKNSRTDYTDGVISSRTCSFGDREDESCACILVSLSVPDLKIYKHNPTMLAKPLIVCRG